MTFFLFLSKNPIASYEQGSIQVSRGGGYYIKAQRFRYCDFENTGGHLDISRSELHMILPTMDMPLSSFSPMIVVR